MTIHFPTSNGTPRCCGVGAVTLFKDIKQVTCLACLRSLVESTVDNAIESAIDRFIECQKRVDNGNLTF